MPKVPFLSLKNQSIIPEGKRMPIYEYRCGKCGHCFERIQGSGEAEKKIVCPECGAAKAERIMSSFSCGGGKGIEAGGAPAGGCGSGGGRFS